MPDTVLFVDDEENVLSAVTRVFSGTDLRILTASDAARALDILRREPVAVLVADNLMPGMKGMDLLKAARSLSPDTVKIMMTAFADLTTVMEAVTGADAFRFIVKPWDTQELVETVREVVERHRVERSRRREDDSVLHALAETIELKDPYTRGHCERVARYALMMADALRLPEGMKKDIRYGSWLHDCGKIGIPESILNASRKLDADEFAVIRLHPDWGAEVARKARMSPTVVNIIRYHHEQFDGGGYPSRFSGRDIPVEARIVAIADTYDAITTERPYRCAHAQESARALLRSLRGKRLDPEITEIFLGLLAYREENGSAGGNDGEPPGRGWNESCARGNCEERESMFGGEEA
ncbi:MAG: HD domain-containing protein [Geobacteraceae bacterium]|nr:HD domain-containing protein [Geobacteraceae bacterium]